MRKIVSVGILSAVGTLAMMSGCSSEAGSQFSSDGEDAGGPPPPTGTFSSSDAGLPGDDPPSEGGVSGDAAVPVVCGDGILGGAEA